MEGKDKAVIAKMAALLRQGATMLDKTCPHCGVPLFKLKSGEIICPKCGQRFVFVSSDEEEIEARSNIELQSLESVVSEKIAELRMMLGSTHDVGDIEKIGSALEKLLSVLESARRIRGSKGGG